MRVSQKPFFSAEVTVIKNLATGKVCLNCENLCCTPVLTKALGRALSGLLIVINIKKS